MRREEGGRQGAGERYGSRIWNTRVKEVALVDHFSCPSVGALHPFLPPPSLLTSKVRSCGSVIQRISFASSAATGAASGAAQHTICGTSEGGEGRGGGDGGERRLTQRRERNGKAGHRKGRKSERREGGRVKGREGGEVLTWEMTKWYLTAPMSSL